ncbi:uncharacterized protein LOC120700549 [Panicum virgatum]|uniref:Uncharacterized protein n=1 Tax=Panicum virgatum TaxID=38727 RepID=A0A8T0UTD0_PANVG|nr:uncharacterized protein LOC120700549 [Panicum virgatum]KAG2624154.1 hypothetical protein PVAP13_3KG135327 [Panicum virgatum]
MASKISLKLLVDTKTKTVLFAEAGKEFVDFVFSLLTLPIGAVAKLVSAGTMHGSVGRLYQSVERIGAIYLQPGTDKSDLLQPKMLNPDARELLLLQAGGDGEPALARFRLYTCAGYCATATMEAKATCLQCKQAMSTEVAFVLPSAAAPAPAGSSSSSSDESGGYVKGVVTYMVTDGLEVTPMSAISSITMINKFAGKDVELAEKFVAVGTGEGLALLKAALRSDTVLRKKCQLDDGKSRSLDDILLLQFC